MAQPICGDFRPVPGTSSFVTAKWAGEFRLLIAPEPAAIPPVSGSDTKAPRGNALAPQGVLRRGTTLLPAVPLSLRRHITPLPRDV
jgi:hypothetical protein